MATPVTRLEIEKLNEEIERAEGGRPELGLLIVARLSEIARDMSRWQWVQHGGTGDYRAACVRWLGRAGKLKAARRFALCGRGDCLMKEVGGEKVRVKAKGCGARYCPRCSRRFGRKFLCRVNEHLSARPHGELWHFVFTQRACPGEPLAECRARFEKSWKRAYRKMRLAGLVSGLVTYHLVRNRANAWHWHAHLVAELSEGTAGAERHVEYQKIWSWAKGKAGADDMPLFGRQVCDAGLAMDGLREDRQMDLWTESANEAEKALQYVVRDVLQGVEKWIGHVSEPAIVEEFAGGVEGAKMHRLLGNWRHRVKEAEAPKEEAKPTEEQKAAGIVVSKDDGRLFESVGTVDRVLYEAKRGITACAEMVRSLVLSGANQGFVSARLRKAAHFVLG